MKVVLNTSSPSAGWPSPPAVWLDRPARAALLDEIRNRPLTVVTAAAGYGKTALVAAWGRARPDCHYRSMADEHAVTSLLDGCESGAVVVVDDVDQAADPRAVVGLIERARPGVHLVLLGRSAVAFPLERLRGRGQVLQIDARELAFTEDEVAALLTGILPHPACPGLARAVYRLAAGWPAAVVLTAEWLARKAPETWLTALDSAGGVGGPLFGYVAAELLGGLSSSALELLRAVAFLPRFHTDTCASAGIDAPKALLAHLHAQGVLRHHGTGWYSTGPLVAEVLQIPEPGLARRLVAGHAPRLVADGYATELLAICVALPDPIELVEARARRTLGDWTGAVRCLERATPSAERTAELALTHHLLGDPRAVLEVCRRGGIDTDPMVLAWEAVACWFRNDVRDGRAVCGRAVDAARRTGHTPALTMATAIRGAFAELTGDRLDADRWHAEAAQHAQRCAVGALRAVVLGHRAFRALDDGDYSRGLAELDEVIAEATQAGDRGIVLHARCRAAGAKLALGRCDEAEADLRAALDGYRRSGSHAGSRALTGLGNVHRIRGELALAADTYREAVAICEVTEDHQTLGQALAGLARVVLADDPDAAAELAARAVATCGGVSQVDALLAAGWIALARDEPVAATGFAERAAGLAAALGYRAGHAESLELRALLFGQPVSLLREALETWCSVGHELGAAQCRVALARIASVPAALEETQERLRLLGVRAEAENAAGLLNRVPVPVHCRLLVKVLGTFQVLRDGVPIGVEDWRSKKARDLVKILLARRGHSTPREQLISILWPDEDTTACANRLSVLLSIVRAVLDPGRVLPQDHFVVADKYSIGLTGLRVDVEEFLATARPALLRGDETALAAAETRYTGDFLEEDPYEDWAVGMREEAKALYLQVVAVLSRRAADRGDHEQAICYWLRLLAKDPYDEEAHLGVITSLRSIGRHGEARRRHRLYVDALTRLGLPAKPF